MQQHKDFKVLAIRLIHGNPSRKSWQLQPHQPQNFFCNFFLHLNRFRSHNSKGQTSAKSAALSHQRKQRQTRETPLRDKKSTLQLLRYATDKRNASTKPAATVSIAQLTAMFD
eukprot:603334-Amphidinium_carterae.1